MVFRWVMSTIICFATIGVADAKKKKTPKKKREPAPYVRVGHKDSREGGGRAHILTVSVYRGDAGVTGTVYAIYRHDGGVYSCQKQPITEVVLKEDPKDKKKKNQKDNKDKKDKEKASRRPVKSTFTFPHTNGEGTYIDYVAVLYQKGKLVSTATSRSSWEGAAEKLQLNSDGKFNSRGDAAGEEKVGHTEIDGDLIEAGKRLKAKIEREEKNRKMEKEMNK